MDRRARLYKILGLCPYTIVHTQLRWKISLRPTAASDFRGGVLIDNVCAKTMGHTTCRAGGGDAHIFELHTITRSRCRAMDGGRHVVLGRASEVLPGDVGDLDLHFHFVILHLHDDTFARGHKKLSHLGQITDRSIPRVNALRNIDR